MKQIYLLTLLFVVAQAYGNSYYRVITKDDSTKPKQTIHQRVAQIPKVSVPVHNATPVYNEFFTKEMERFVDSILLLMTLEEKLTMLQGDIAGKAPRTRGSAAIDRLGIKPLVFYNGPRGFQIGRKSTLFPNGQGQAASFRPEIVEQIGAAVAKELMERNFHVLEAPSMNIIRDPYNGRNFEYFTEDPFLNGHLTAAFVVGGQRAGAVTTAKHFIANNKEQNRGQLNAVVDERALHEIYLPAFKMACDAGVLSLMTGANRVNGPHASDNAQLINILKNDWEWPGFLYTDWNGVQTTMRAFDAGLDLSMPGKPSGPWTVERLMEFYKEGKLDIPTLDEKVRRVLRGVYFAGNINGAPQRQKEKVDYPAHHRLAYKAALAGMVLVKNDKNTLPINSSVSRIAVVGPMAEKKFSRESGGSSGVARVMYDTTALDGLCKEFGEKIMHVPFSVNELYEPINASYVSHKNKEGKLVPGYMSTYAGRDPQTDEYVKINKVEKEIDFNWEMASPNREKIGPSRFRAIWEGILTPPISGNYTIRIKGTQIVRLYINGKLVSNKHRIQRERETDMQLEAGKEYKIRMEFGKKYGDSSIQLAWLKPDAETKLNAKLEKSVEAAKNSDLAIVLVGLDHNTESEGMDRFTMGLPDYQNTLVEKVLDVNPNTVVVVYGGTPIEMDSWFNKASTIVLPWFPGIENGNALATLLAGKVDFGGRMPITFPKKYEDSPAHPSLQLPDKNDTIEHNEGIFVGYRWFDEKNIDPLIPFGHGLSYTKFKYGKLKLKKTGNVVNVKIDVTNTGNRDGIEVVQVYVSDKQCDYPRPPRELKDFKSINLAKGEKKTISFTLDESAFSYWNPKKRSWTLDPGEFDIEIGRSSRNIIKKVNVKF